MLWCPGTPLLQRVALHTITIAYLGIQFLSSGQDDIDGMSQHSRCVLDLSQHHLVPARTLLAYVSSHLVEIEQLALISGFDFTLHAMNGARITRE